MKKADTLQYYYDRKNKGLCTLCRLPWSGTTIYCGSCKIERSEARKRQRLTRITTGICTDCKMPAKPNRVMCHDCTTKQKLTDRHGYQKAMANGLCTRCRINKSLPNRVQCFSCSTYHNNKHIESKYNIDIKVYYDMYENQKGFCKICKVHFGKLDIDHDHITGKIRGLLCNPCNRFIGMAKENTNTLLNAITYLEEANNGSNE